MSVSKNPPTTDSSKSPHEVMMEELIGGKNLLDHLEYMEELPSSSPQGLSDIENLNFITEVFQQIEAESAKIAELLFEYLINASDGDILSGTIPDHEDPKIKKYIKILNRLFRFSRKNPKGGGFRIISRNTIEDLDKKTYMICMCHDGGMSLDILCDIVNAENGARTPSRSPVRVVVKQAFGQEQSR